MKELIQRGRRPFVASERRDAQIPDGIWIKCPACRELLYQKQLHDNQKVCPKCGHHLRLTVREWLELLDPDTFEEYDADLLPTDPLGFATPKETYAAKLVESREKTAQPDVVVSGIGTLEGTPLSLAICEFEFMGGSMGSVFGEKMLRAAERALEHRLPLLTINRSGGARMQEGVIALMQMAKISVALTRLMDAGLPHISLMADPCYGGVTASYASVADVIIAEPGASIGFAGKRVIEQTIRQKLPPDFQTAEFLLAHGMIDMVVQRRDLRTTLGRLLRLYADGNQGVIL